MTDLISEGSSLMLFGMGFVFLFLSLLVLATRLMSTIITCYFPAAKANPTPASPSPASTDHQGELVAAISAAIALHRSKNNQQNRLGE